MEGYDGWYEDDENAAGAGGAPPLQQQRSPPVPAPRGGGLSPNAAAGSAARRSVVVFETDQDAAQAAPSDMSRIFPKVSVKSRRSTRAVEPNVDIKDPIYKDRRWLLALVMVVVLLGSFAMIVIGCLCVSQYYEVAAESFPTTAATAAPTSTATNSTQAPTATPTTPVDNFQAQICGPAGGGGGIVMIIAGLLGLIVAGYQMWRLREPMLALAGYRSWA